MQIYSKIIKSFLCLASQLMLCTRTWPLMLACRIRAADDIQVPSKLSPHTKQHSVSLLERLSARPFFRPAFCILATLDGWCCVSITFAGLFVFFCEVFQTFLFFILVSSFLIFYWRSLLYSSGRFWMAILWWSLKLEQYVYDLAVQL